MVGGGGVQVTSRVKQWGRGYGVEGEDKVGGGSATCIEVILMVFVVVLLWCENTINMVRIHVGR